MNKGSPSKGPAIDLSKYSKSSFTLTFVIEMVGSDIWHDSNEGWQQLGPCIQGVKLQYQLYPGHNYDLDVMIWPNVAKIWCGAQYGWVRTFLLLERRWLTFSIRHAFPVRVAELAGYVATVTPSVGLGVLGSTAKSDKNIEIHFPPLKFMERRYFAPVMETEESIQAFIDKLIWNAVTEYIPKSYLDGPFDVPYPVKDIRHQDTALFYIKEAILNRTISEEPDSPKQEVEEPKPRNRRESKVLKEKEKKKIAEIPKVKYGLNLSGVAIIAGTGRLTPFETSGDLLPDIGEIKVLISSDNLPAQDDQPVFFVNIDKLFQIPVTEFKKLGIFQLYTQWNLGDHEHSSSPQNIRSRKNFVDFNDHYALVQSSDNTMEAISIFLDNPFEIQLRGIRLSLDRLEPKLFGHSKTDRYFDKILPNKSINENVDFLIATTKIDLMSISEGKNGLVRGEYPLYPPKVAVLEKNRELISTNDINGIRNPMKPELIVPTSLILLAQMTVKVSIGLVGCRPRKMTSCYSRLYALVSNSDVITELLQLIININDKISKTAYKDDMLTGFAIDTGDILIIYIEGVKDCAIAHIWRVTETYYPKIKPVFSSSAKHSRRIYPELLLSSVPFTILKMYVPLTALLACPPIYARPVLPLPARSAALKLGRLIASKLLTAPSCSEMPTGAELKSFGLELCVTPIPPSSFQTLLK